MHILFRAHHRVVLNEMLVSMIGLRLRNRVMTRTFFSFRVKPVQLPVAGPSSLIPKHELVDEEAWPAYNSKYTYPAKPGEILANYYQLLVKIGWGTRSTVWLARDITRYKWQSERLVTLKILNNRSSGDGHHELNIEKHIAQQNSSHLGYDILRTHLESFKVASLEGDHLCLVYESMREPLWLLRKRFTGQKFPLVIAKAYMLLILAGLDYMHTDCRVVHTDLKLENILVTLENKKVLSDFIKRQTTNMPMQYKTDPSTERTIYRCHNNFGPLDLKGVRNMFPKIVDFGSAKRLDSENSEGKGGKQEIGIHPIQPDHYRAPEVILGCGWRFSTDIWNFGLLAWDILERTELFQQVHDSQGHYNIKAHLAEMIALLGPPPKKLIQKSDDMARYKLPDTVGNGSFRNPRDYFGGPFFNEEGQFLYDELIPDRKLEDTIPSLEKKEKEAFLSFVRQMITWLPEERKTASELMEHPFLKFGDD